jgi:uncharacterized membrane protein YidH (DUF202 family)
LRFVKSRGVVVVAQVSKNHMILMDPPPPLFSGVTPVIPRRLMKSRQIKVEPKVPFANERTFLAYMEWATFLAGTSIAFASFSEVKNDPLSQIIGLLMLPFSIGVIIYALFEYTNRSEMIQHGAPTDKFASKYGPVILSALLSFSLVSTFFVKLLT